MKKILGIVLATMLTVFCFACGGKEQQVVCTMETEESGVSYEIILDAKGDVVQKMTQVTSIDLLMYTEDQIAALEQNVKAYEDLYEEFSGVEYKVDVTSEEMCETIVFDMTNEDTVNSLKNSDMLSIEGDLSEISLEKILEKLKSDGWSIEE